MIELNLLPDVKKEFLKAQRTRNAVVSGSIMASLIAGGLIAFLATTVYVAQAGMINNQRSHVKDLHSQLMGKSELNKYLAIQSQLEAVNKVSSGRSLYSRLFDYLLQLNPSAPSNVTLYSVDIDKAASTMVVTGSASTFEAVNNYKNTLELATLTYTVSGTPTTKPMFSSVVADQPSLSTNNGKTSASFKLTVIFEPDAYDPAIADVKVNVPKLVTSDADQNAPKDLFGTEPQTKEQTNGN